MTDIESLLDQYEEGIRDGALSRAVAREAVRRHVSRIERERDQWKYAAESTLARIEAAAKVIESGTTLTLGGPLPVSQVHHGDEK